MVPCSWWWAYAPETCRAKETSINYTVPSSWHFALFHDEDARSNNPQISIISVSEYQPCAKKKYVPIHHTDVWQCTAQISPYFISLIAPKGTKICCGFLRTGFRSNDRKQYSWSLLRPESSCANNYRNAPDGTLKTHIIFEIKIFKRDNKIKDCVIIAMQCLFISTIVQSTVAQLVEALHYKPEGRRFDSWLCHWNFSLT